MTVTLPAFMLSGFVYPIASLPLFLQWLSALSPPRYYIVVLRGVLLKSATLDSLWPSVLALAIFAVVLLTASTVMLSRRLS